jgi:hypothetical protein
LSEDKPSVRLLLPLHEDIPEGFEAVAHSRVFAGGHFIPRAGALVVEYVRSPWATRKRSQEQQAFANNPSPANGRKGHHYASAWFWDEKLSTRIVFLLPQQDSLGAGMIEG